MKRTVHLLGILLALFVIFTAAPAVAHDSPLHAEAQQQQDELIQTNKAGTSSHYCWHFSHTKLGDYYYYNGSVEWWGNHYHFWKVYDGPGRIGFKYSTTKRC